MLSAWILRRKNPLNPLAKVFVPKSVKRLRKKAGKKKAREMANHLSFGGEDAEEQGGKVDFVPEVELPEFPIPLKKRNSSLEFKPPGAKFRSPNAIPEDQIVLGSGHKEVELSSKPKALEFDEPFQYANMWKIIQGDLKQPPIEPLPEYSGRVYRSKPLKDSRGKGKLKLK
jgi:hypothetical protein